MMRDLTKIKTLYVDDMSTIRSVLKKHFVQLDFADVEGASDGVDAWVQIKKANQSGAPFELILCDWIMPKLDGIDLLRMIRSHPDAGIREARFIMIAGSDDKFRRAMDAGADNVLAKPFSTSVLEKKIEFVFRRDAE
jgi:two-component system chemotaxis response regulator CheY